MEYLSDGISETIISSLSRLPDVKVISSVSSFRYKGKDVDPQTLGRKLGVSAVVVGRVVQRGEDLSISAELVDTSDASQLWGDQYVRKLADIFAIQEEMATENSRSLQLRLSREKEASLTKRYTENTEAYQAYLRGRYFWNKRSEEGFQKAIEYFEQAIEKDADYPLAYSGLADCYNLLGYYNFLPPREAYPKAREAAEKALEIDETLAEAHTSLGWVTFIYDWEWEESEKEFKRAIELNPSYATARHWYSVYLGAVGRHDEALRECRIAVVLGPQSLVINRELGNRLRMAGRHDEAEEWFRKALDMDARLESTHIQLGYLYMDKRMYEEAIAQFHVAGDDGLGSLGLAYAASGNKEEALAILERLQTLASQRYVSPLQLAYVYTGLGDKDSAFEWLERAYDERVSDLVFLKALALMREALSSDPRFGNLMRRIGLER
jgi:TolB-like protein/Tfp pilus assembly protein PilF